MHDDPLPHRISVPVAGASSEYEILVGVGLQRTLGEILTRYCPAHRFALITDERVRDLYGISMLEALRGAGLQVDLFAFPAGEEHKTRGSWAALTDAMLATGIGRDGAVLALGGGVAGDLAGFVAATYMRGLPWVQLPTTLLAMIDASIGGKTGVDVPGGKNLVGAFHPPRAVVADTERLRTLPPAQLRAGLAEAVKHGALADAAYLRWIVDMAEVLLGADVEALLRLVVRSIEIKAEVVARDERESGPRKMLNFGHTLGHAIEAASHYRLLHGEAVAIGMVLEARIGERIGVTEPGTGVALRTALAPLGLPTRVPLTLGVEELLARTRMDKKARAGRVEYALLERLGAAAAGEDGRWGYAVPDEVVREALTP